MNGYAISANVQRRSKNVQSMESTTENTHPTCYLYY